MAKINKIQLDGASYDIRGLIPEVVSSLPVTGEEDMLYLTPAAEPGTRGVTAETSDGYTRIANAPADAPISLAQLQGNAEQETLSGKNLINLANAGTTSNGVTTTFSNNTAHITNTATSSWANLTPSQAGVSFLAGNYTFSIDHTLSYAIRFRATYQDTTSETFSISTGSKSVSFTTAKEITRFYIFIEGFSSGTTFNETINIMLEAGSTATAYEPYCGGVPSPNPSYPQDVNVVSGGQTVKITGKNLSTGATYTGVNTITFTFDNPKIIPKTITISCIPNKSKSGVGVLPYKDNTNLQSVGTMDLIEGQLSVGTITIPDDVYSQLISGTNATIRLYKSGIGFDTTEDVGKPMVEAGTVATPVFEPYQGQTKTVNLGKNLFDLKGFLESKSVTYTEASDGTVTFASVGALYSDPFQFSQEDITVSVQGIISNLTGSNFRLQLINKAGTSVGEINSSTTTRENLSACKVRFNWSNSGTFSLKNIQVEHGSTATTYAPYFTPIELAKIGDYQDYIYPDDGKWYIHKEIGKVVLDGSIDETWVGELYGGFWRARYDFSDIAPITRNTDFVAFSDYFHVSINVLGAQTIGEGDFCQYRNTVQVYFAAPLSVQTSAEWRTWLSTHNTTVYYALATPTDTEITDSELIEQLNFVASLYEGVNNIMLIPSTDPQGEMALTATEYDPQQRYDEYVWVEGEGYEKVGYGSADAALSIASTNPVQNKVITEVIGDVESILRILNSGNGV